MKNIDEALKFFDHFKDGLYLKNLKRPFVHGFFTDREALKKELEQIEDTNTLYFLGHTLKRSDLPENKFDRVTKGGSIKKDDVDKLKYLIIDIDPIDKKEDIDGEKMDRNLTEAENQEVLAEAQVVRQELLCNGFSNVGLISSGNGAYIFIPFRKVSPEQMTTLRGFVQILARRVGLKKSQFDTKTLSPEHVFKLPGCLSTKGKETAENPYRHAVIVEDWDTNGSNVKSISAYIDTYESCKLICYSSISPQPFINVKECIERFEKVYPVYAGDSNDYYVRVKSRGKYRDMRLDSTDFKRELRNYIRRESGEKDINFANLDAVITYMMDQAYTCDNSQLASRAYFDRSENILYYDLCNQREVIKITEKKVEVVDKPLGMFVQALTDEEQVMFEPTSAKELPNLLRQIANLDEDNSIMLGTYLCVCFLGNIFPTPLLLITGEQGSSKSTITRFIQNVIHPQKNGLMSLLEKKLDIAIALSTRLITCFDNASGIKAEIADILCSAVTGGVFQTRKLYSTAQEQLIKFKSIIVINGIDIISRRTDLMQRALLLEMPTITEEQRKSEREVKGLFDSLLPKILGAIFDALKQALAMPEPELEHLGRMADYEVWATKFSSIFGYSDRIQDILRKNRERIVDAVSFGDPTIYAIVEIMRGKRQYEEQFEKFYFRCYEIVDKKMTPNEKQFFPKSSSALSRKIGGLSDNLKAYGLSVVITPTGPFKKVTIFNDGTVIPFMYGNDKEGTLVYDEALDEHKGNQENIEELHEAESEKI